MSSDTSPGGPPQRLTRPSKVSHLIASAIVEDIVRDNLSEGDRLPLESELAERFGVSRVSVREALRLLEMYGVVRIRQGNKGGNVVGAVDEVDLARTLSLFLRMARATYRDLMEARLVIEPFMALRAAEQQDPVQLEAIREIMEQEAASIPETRESDQLAIRFHWVIVGASGNPVLNSIGRALHALYGDKLASRLLFEPGGWSEARHIHSDIGQAILAGDARTAHRLMTEHVAEFLELQEQRTPWFLSERISWEP
jgi:GntR family transcriptional regulator, transcriptional repressor for pyruvate dehydrogenase complex